MLQCIVRRPASLLAPLLLSGCISLPDLNASAGKTAEQASLNVLKNPCGGPKNIALSFAAIGPNTFPTLAPAVAQQSDLEMGKAIVRAAAATRAGERDAGHPRPLGMDIAQFADDEMLVSQAAAASADRAQSRPLALAPAPASIAGFTNGGSEIVVRRGDWLAKLHDIQDATSTDGWTSSFEVALGQMYRTVAIARAAPDQRLLGDLHRKYLLAAYFKAYFRNGEILAFSIASDTLKKDLKAKLDSTIKDATLRKAVEADIDSTGDTLVSDLCGTKAQCLALAVIGETTFLTRAGKSYAFPGITASFDPFAGKKVSTNKIDTNAVIGDLVRVFFEADGDWLYGVPAVTKSTECESVQAYCATEAEAKDIAKVNEIGDRAEAAASSLTGIAVRGGWILSLNNEALATSIQTGVSVIVRKSAEAAAWSILTKQCPAMSGEPAVAPVTIRLN